MVIVYFCTIQTIDEGQSSWSTTDHRTIAGSLVTRP